MGIFDQAAEEFEAQQSTRFDQAISEFEQLQAQPPTSQATTIGAQANRRSTERLLPVELPPLGSTAPRPPSTPAEDGVATLSQGTPEPADPAAGRDLVEEADVFVRNTVKGLPIVGSALDTGATRLQSATSGQPVEDIQAQQQAADIRNPGTATAGEVTGAVAGTIPIVAAAPAAFGLRAGAGVAERVVAGGLSTSALTATDMLTRGAAPEEIIEASTRAGIIGAVVTPFAARIGGILGRTAQSAPAREAIAREAQAFYAAAENSGVGVSNRAFTRLGQDVDAVLTREAFDPTLVPPAVRQVRDIIQQTAGTNKAVPIERIELLRRELVPMTRKAGPENEAERRLAGLILEKFDDFSEKLGSRAYPISVASSMNTTPTEVNAFLRQGREMWRQSRNVGRVEEALANAENSSSGLSTGIRSEFAKLARDRKFMRGLSGEEREAVRDMARMANFRGLGMILAKMDPSRSNLRTTALLGGGAAAGGPAGLATGAAVLTAGRVAERGMSRWMTGRAQDVKRVMAGEPRLRQKLGSRVGVGAAEAEISRRQR